MPDAVKLNIPCEYLLDLIYPATCRYCQSRIVLSDKKGMQNAQRNIFFCASCWQSLERLDDPQCPVCSNPYESDAAISASPNHLCGDCREEPPHFLKAITPYLYKDVMAEAICLLKYEKRTRLAKHLIAAIMEDLSALEVDCVGAVPLHASKLRLREFNQSLLLAKEVSRQTGWHFYLDLLKKRQSTDTQVGLSKKKRKQNVKGVFSVPNLERVQNKRVLLMDDVYTTGATLKEGARVLMKAGVKSVVVCAPARMVFGKRDHHLFDHTASSML